MSILKELLSLIDPTLLFEAEVPIELADVVKAFPAHHGKAINKLWGGKRLVWHGKRFFDDRHYGPAYKEVLAAAGAYIKDGYTVHADLDITGTIDGEEHEGTVSWDIAFDRDTQEVYLGYDPKKDKLYVGYDAWASEDEFNDAFDTAFEQMTGEDYNHELPEHEEVFNHAWKEYSKNYSMWGLIFEVSMRGDSMSAEEAMAAMPGGFYAGTYKLFQQQHPDVIPLRLD